MRKPLPIKISTYNDERIQLHTESGNAYVEVCGIVVDMNRAIKLRDWLSNAIKYVDEKKQ